MSAKNTGAANTTRIQTRGLRSASTPEQWWKVWVLLTSFGATMFGWNALPSVEPPIGEGLVPQAATAVEDASAPDVAVNPLREPRTLRAIARTEPAMPQKPVFRAPVTRTRRS